MNKIIKKSILCLLSIFSLVSCSSGKDQIIVEDLTLSTAKKYAKLYLNNVWKTDDMYGKYLSILAYFEKFNDKYYVLTFEYGSINPVNGTVLEGTCIERIEGLKFNWNHLYDYSIGRIFINDNIYTLTEAYQNKLISYNDLKKYHKVYDVNQFESSKSPYIYKFINSLDRGVRYEKN